MKNKMKRMTVGILTELIYSGTLILIGLLIAAGYLRR